MSWEQRRRSWKRCATAARQTPDAVLLRRLTQLSKENETLKKRVASLLRGGEGMLRRVVDLCLGQRVWRRGWHAPRLAVRVDARGAQLEEDVERVGDSRVPTRPVSRRIRRSRRR